MQCSNNDRLGSKQLINHTEYIRLLEQSLRDLNFPDVAERLEQASGIQQEHSSVWTLRNALSSGDWATAIHMVSQLGLTDSATVKQAKFLILQEKLLEHIDSKDVTAALTVLREELTPLQVNLAHVHALASRVLRCCNDAAPAGDVAPDPAARRIEARAKLLTDLQAVIPSDILLPSRRLETLLESALEGQLSGNVFHNSTPEGLSLMSDYHCGKEQLPTHTVQVLDDHTDEVWHVAFSHDGRQLASTSKDTTAILWDVADGRLSKRLTLSGHTEAVVLAAWSPDDSLIATAGNDDVLTVWDTASGDARISLRGRHALGGDASPFDSTVISSVAWLPCGERFVTSTLHKRLCLWNTSGTLLRVWDGHPIQDLEVSPCGQWVVAVTSTRDITLISVDSKEEFCYRQEKGLLSCKLSSDGGCLLVSMQDETLQLWDLHLGSEHPLGELPAQICEHPRNQVVRFVIKACLGGYGQSFVLSGSKAAQVLIWHRKTGQLLASLDGHYGPVTSVDWNPRQPGMFVSASDDMSVHVWGPDEGRGGEAGRDGTPLAEGSLMSMASGE